MSIMTGITIICCTALVCATIQNIYGKQTRRTKWQRK